MTCRVFHMKLSKPFIPPSSFSSSLPFTPSATPINPFVLIPNMHTHVLSLSLSTFNPVILVRTSKTVSNRIGSLLHPMLYRAIQRSVFFHRPARPWWTDGRHLLTRSLAPPQSHALSYSLDALKVRMLSMAVESCRLGPWRPCVCKGSSAIEHRPSCWKSQALGLRKSECLIMGPQRKRTFSSCSDATETRGKVTQRSTAFVHIRRWTHPLLFGRKKDRVKPKCVFGGDFFLFYEKEWHHQSLAFQL